MASGSEPLRPTFQRGCRYSCRRNVFLVLRRSERTIWGQWENPRALVASRGAQQAHRVFITTGWASPAIWGARSARRLTEAAKVVDPLTGEEEVLLALNEIEL